jgi:polyisoprenoid-binding protein YceI
MKKLFAFILAAGFATSAMATKQTENYNVDVKTSKITWLGKKVTGEHTGAVALKGGSLIVEGDKITGGKFEVDLNTMTCSDIENAEYNGKLIGHLKSDDFFSAEKFPTATLVIKKAEYKDATNVEFTADLTIKGITKEIKFSSVAKVSGAKLAAKSTIVVDRTLFDIKYGSASFFESIGDKAIENNFTLDVTLVAVK